MNKFAVFLFILFLAVLGYLAILNQETVSLRLSEKHIFDVPQVALILLASAFGAFAMLLFIAVRDTRRYFDGLQHIRHQKKSLKVQDSYSKGIDAFCAGRYDEAVELFDRVIAQESNHVSALIRRGDVAFKRGDFAGAKEYYQKAKEIRPHSIEVLLSLENVFRFEDNWKGALRYLDSILEIDRENPRALRKKREIYEKLGDWESLVDVQQKILKTGIPESEKTLEENNLLGYQYELGRHFLEKGEFENAIKTLSGIIKHDREFIAAYLALAETHIGNGNHKEAENLLLQGYHETSSLVFLLRLEDYFIALGEPGRIIDLYQKAVQGSPRDQNLQFFIAKLYYRLEMIDDALETVENIDLSSIDYPELHILLGDIYQRRGQHDKSAVEFKTAIKFKRPLLVPYCCSNCKYITKEWEGRCPKCSHWNSLTLDISGTCKI